MAGLEVGSSMDFGPDQLMTVREVAEYLRVPIATIYAWRYQGEGPVVTKLRTKSIRFRRGDVDAWNRTGDGRCGRVGALGGFAADEAKYCKQGS